MESPKIIKILLENFIDKKLLIKKFKENKYNKYNNNNINKNININLNKKRSREINSKLIGKGNTLEGVSQVINGEAKNVFNDAKHSLGLKNYKTYK